MKINNLSLSHSLSFPFCSSLICLFFFSLFFFSAAIAELINEGVVPEQAFQRATIEAADIDGSAAILRGVAQTARLPGQPRHG